MRSAHSVRELEAMSFGSFAARFADEKSRFAWCCSDPEVVREYEENPLCGFTFSDDAFFALNDLLKETYGFHGWHCTNRKLPVLFLSGGDDPCYVNVRRFKKSIDQNKTNHESFSPLGKNSDIQLLRTFQYTSYMGRVAITFVFFGKRFCVIEDGGPSYNG